MKIKLLGFHPFDARMSIFPSGLALSSRHLSLSAYSPIARKASLMQMQPTNSYSVVAWMRRQMKQI